LQRHYSLEKLLGRKVLIIGDLGSGKTLLTANLLDQAVGMGDCHQITVIDMAPLTRGFHGMRIGGILAEVTKAVAEVRYLKPKEVKAPRAMARNAEELMRLADFNRRVIDQTLTEYLLKPTPLLFINDVSIYLQAGEIAKVLSAVRKSQTCIANGYFGKKLAADFGTGISRREQTMMRRLMREMDVTLRLRRP